MARPALSALSALLVLAAAGPAHAGAKVTISDDTHASVGLLIQPQLRADMNGNYEKDAWAYTPYLRRARILLSGQVTDKVHFFFDTDSPNLGKSGDWTPTMYVQDAFVEYNVAPELQVDVGMLLLPFTRHGSQGATSLLMTDYHSTLIRYPSGSHKVWRDAGVMVRGVVAKKAEYRLAVTNGVQSGYGVSLTEDSDGDGVPDKDPRGVLNPSDLPRVTGRVVYNVFDAEGGPGAGGFFYKGAGLKVDGKRIVTPKRILAVGLSADYQGLAAYEYDAKDAEDLTDDEWGRIPYMGLAADVFADLPMGDNGARALNAQATFVRYDYGDVQVLTDPAKGTLGYATGMGGFLEAGFRVNRWEPLVAAELYDVTEGDTSDYLAVLGGVAWWYQGHAANVKAEIGASRTGADSDFGLAGTVQTQLLF